MNPIIWHILKKDFRRLRFYIALLALFIGCDSAVQLLANTLNSPEGRTSGSRWLATLGMCPWLEAHVRPHLEGMAVMSYGVSVVLMYFLIVAAVMEDAPLSDKAFWRTRPVTGGQMFAAKFSFVLLVSVPLQAFSIALTAALLYPEWETSYFLHSLVLASGMMLIVSMTMLATTTLWRNPVIGAGALLLPYLLHLFLFNPWSIMADTFFVYAWPVLAMGIAASVYISHRQRTGFAMLTIGVAVYYLWPVVLG
ncbi:MAG TPA: hypothetical protein VHC95_00835 [Opitutales bacterium]|nr:hypothetical protein [Opitutales bacterium]